MLPPLLNVFETKNMLQINPFVFSGGTSYSGEVRSDSPVAYWRLGESSGSVAATEVGSTSGTYTGGYTLGQAGSLFGDIDTSVLFNGSNGYVATSGTPHSFERTSPFSVEFWVYLTTSGGGVAFIGCLDDSNGFRGWEVNQQDFGNNEWLQFFLINDFGSSNAIQVEANWAFTINEWHHIVVTYDGTSSANGVIFYRNAVPLAKRSPVRDSLSLTSVSAKPLRIAARHNNTVFLPGRLDEVAVYDSVLSPARVLAHYNKGSGA